MNDERSRDSAAKIAADRSFLSDDELIRRITAFADEGSGIGELREDQMIEIANKAVEENLNEDGTAKFGTAQGYACALSALRLSQSS